MEKILKKKIIPIIFLSFLISIEYNLEDFIKIGLENNTLINLAKEDKKIAFANSIEARSTALPKLQFFSSVTRNHDLADQPILFPIFPGLLDQNGHPVVNDSTSYYQATGLIMSEFNLPMGTDFFGAVGLNINQTLFDGRVFTAIRASKIYDQLTEESYNVVVENVIENIKLSFYSALLSKKITKVIKKSLERAISNYDNTKLLFGSGKLNELELIRAESLVKDQEILLKNAKKNEILALERLNLIVGLKNNNNLKIIGDDDINYDIPPLEQSKERLLKKQPLIKQIKANQLLMKENVNAFLSEFYPSINFSASVQKLQSDTKDNFKFEYDSFKNNSSISLNVSLPLFDGFGSSARVMKARADAKKAKYQVDDLKKQLLLELKNIYLDLNESREKIYAGEKKIELAEKGYTIARDLFNNGMITQLDLFSAEINLSQAELQLLQTKYEYKIALAKLSRATGENTKGID